VLGDIQEQAEAPPPAEEPRRIKPGRDAEEPVRSEPPVAAAASEPMPAPTPEPEPEPAPEEPVAEEVVVAPAPEVEPEPEPEMAPEAEPASQSPQPQPAWLAAQAESAEAPAQESLAELLARFERALERKTSQQRAAAPATADAEETSPEDGMDLRLRSALENLRRFAPSRG
jgi:outer membrane biosynthesis protein TonB